MIWRKDDNGAWIGRMEARFRALAAGQVSAEVFLNPEASFEDDPGSPIWGAMVLVWPGRRDFGVDPIVMHVPA